LKLAMQPCWIGRRGPARSRCGAHGAAMASDPARCPQASRLGRLQLRVGTGEGQVSQSSILRMRALAHSASLLRD